MPSAAASRAVAASRSPDSRSTPGIEAIGSRVSCPSVTNSGQIRSAGLSSVSATIARDQAWARLRRGRSAG